MSGGALPEGLPAPVVAAVALAAGRLDVSPRDALVLLVGAGLGSLVSMGGGGDLETSPPQHNARSRTLPKGWTHHAHRGDPCCNEGLPRPLRPYECPACGGRLASNELDGLTCGDCGFSQDHANDPGTWGPWFRCHHYGDRCGSFRIAGVRPGEWPLCPGCGRRDRVTRKEDPAP